jgi:hypothetical protein
MIDAVLQISGVGFGGFFPLLLLAVFVIIIYFLAKFLLKANRVMDAYLKKQKQEKESSKTP